MKLFKKVFAVLLVLLLIAGCSNDAGTDGGASSKTIDELKVVFVPSRDAQDIEKQTEPLKELLQTELAKSGYEVASVAIETMTSYEAAGEALSAGSAHIGLIPGGTYAAFYYRGIIIAGPSEKGQDLAQKAKDDALTWDEVSTAKWCVSSPSSGSGYQYPAVWLNDRFEQSLPNMAENTVTTQGYGDAAAKLANEQCDVAPGYNDFRMDNDEAWVSEFGLENIWTETSIIGVTDKIQNDTVSVSAELVDDELATAIADAFINLAGTEAGAEAIKIYNHNGYQKVTDADYEGAKKVNELVKSWNE